MHFELSRQQAAAVLWEPLCPRGSRGQSPAVCGLTRGVQVGPRLRGAHSLGAARSHFVTAVQPLELPGSTEIATESCRGKGLKSFPFTFGKYTRNTWKRKGCQECCWEEGQLFVFCPPTEYNLFKYLHVLLLKDFPFFPVLFWLLSYEWWRWRDL